MSGGQQQRVALARAIVNQPRYCCSTSRWRRSTRSCASAMQIELQNLQRELGITFVLVTHDQEEALSMSDLVCVMNAGRIVQLGIAAGGLRPPGRSLRRRFRRQDQPATASRSKADGSTLAAGRRLGAVGRPGEGICQRAGDPVAIRPETIRLTRETAQTARAFRAQSRTASSSARRRNISQRRRSRRSACHRRPAQPAESDLVEPGEGVVLSLRPGRSRMSFRHD